jgi:hypothetical protein
MIRNELRRNGNYKYKVNKLKNKIMKKNQLIIASIIAGSSGGTSYAPMEAGNYPARCYSMIHLGTGEEEFKGDKKLMNQISLTFEFPTEMKVFKEGELEKPYVISKIYTLSMHEKAGLRIMLESWRGKKFTEEEAKAFDVTKLLGVAGMLNVVHNVKGDKTYANIGSMSPLPKGLSCPPQINPTFEFNFTDKFDANALESLPDFIKERIKRSNEFNALLKPEHTMANKEDETWNPDLKDAPEEKEEIENSDLPF